MVVLGTLYDLIKTYILHRMKELKAQTLSINTNNEDEHENLIEVKKEKSTERRNFWGYKLFKN